MSLKIVVFVAVALAAALVSSSTLGTNSNGGLKDLLLELEEKLPISSRPPPDLMFCFQSESATFNGQTQRRQHKAQKLCTKISGIDETLKGPMEKFVDGFKTLTTQFWPFVLVGDLGGSSAVYDDVKTRSWEIVKNVTTAADESKNADLKRQADKLKNLLNKWEKEEKEMTDRIRTCTMSVKA